MLGWRRMADLGIFLRAARARLGPQDVGLPAAGRRRVPGLRREEVAELIGVSEVWYARCEAGKARFSVRALHRLADALSLATAQRRELFALARPEIGIPVDKAAPCGDLASWRRLVRELTAASSAHDVIAAIVRNLHDGHDRERGVFGLVTESAPRRVAYVAASGLIAGIEGDVEREHHAGWDLALAARLSGCVDLALIATDEMRERCARTGQRSYLTATVESDGTCVGAFGFADRRIGPPCPTTLARVDAVQGLATLALRGARTRGDAAWRMAARPVPLLLLDRRAGADRGGARAGVSR
ncbi:helix-turn-helix transcriptional regulator [Vulcanimicrobium alpinum]|nr:helix-turn-helix transcriptional regulator [Vulcanimicrobium alpinum]